MTTRFTALVLTTLLVACGGDGAGDDASADDAAVTPPGAMPADLTAMDSIRGRGRDGPEMSVCALVSAGSRGAGVFEVTALGSRAEAGTAWTYAALRRTETWYGDPAETTVARMPGGLAGGTLTDAEVGLKVGGTYGLLLAEAGDGYVGVFTQGAFGEDASLGGLNEHPLATPFPGFAALRERFAAEHDAPTTPCNEVWDAGEP